MSSTRTLRSLLALLLPLAGCDALDPHRGFCERAATCGDIDVLLDDAQCGKQLHASLRDYNDRCRSCVLNLNCKGMARALQRSEFGHASQLENVCAECAPLTAPSKDGQEHDALAGLALRRAAASSESPSLAFCKAMDACEELELLVSASECARQLDSRLVDQRSSCSDCVTQLTCSGALDIVAGTTPLNRLCEACPRTLATLNGAQSGALLSTIRKQVGEDPSFAARILGLESKVAASPMVAEQAPDQRRAAQSE